MHEIDPVALAHELQDYLENAPKGDAIRPDDYHPWHWPPHQISIDYRVQPKDWTGQTSFHSRGEDWHVEVADIESGVFGRATDLRCEARGNTLEEMLENLQAAVEPALERWEKIAQALGRPGIYRESIRSLKPIDFLKLLYAPDRAISRDAQAEVEAFGQWPAFGPSLLVILKNQTHPYRRQAQWVALDLCEDLPGFFPSKAEQEEAVETIVNLMRHAQDDYARTIFKAGVVLGGHVCSPFAAEKVLALMKDESRITRRSVIHCVFHLAEWLPEKRDAIIDALNERVDNDPEPKLRPYAAAMARDIAREEVDHMLEPFWPEDQRPAT